MKHICPRCNEPFMFRVRKIWDPECALPFLRYLHKSRSTCPMRMFAESDGRPSPAPYHLVFPSGQLDWAANKADVSLWTPTNGLTIVLPKRLPYTITEEELHRYLILV